jgi:hypothetical protein
MTHDELQAIKARAEAATPGPWANKVPGRDDEHMCRLLGPAKGDAREVLGLTWHPEVPVSYVGLSRQQCVDNAAFIAHARTDVPALVEAVENLRWVLSVIGERQDGAWGNFARVALDPTTKLSDIRERWTMK